MKIIFNIIMNCLPVILGYFIVAFVSLILIAILVGIVSAMIKNFVSKTESIDTKPLRERIEWCEKSIMSINQSIDVHADLLIKMSEVIKKVLPGLEPKARTKPKKIIPMEKPNPYDPNYT